LLLLLAVELWVSRRRFMPGRVFSHPGGCCAICRQQGERHRFSN
jgi:hypothetical protein